MVQHCGKGALSLRATARDNGAVNPPEPDLSPAFISVIIPVYNDTERLLLCLAALEAQTYPRHRFEVVVIDNGSSVPVAEAIGQHAGCVILVSEPRPGGFVARNAGIERARGEILAFTDADCLPAPTWLGELAKALDGRRTLLAGPIEAFPMIAARPTPSERFDMLWGFPQHRFVEDGYGASANLAMPRAVFDEVGPFSTHLLSDGDQEWCQRAGRLGVPIRYAAEAVVRHPARRTVHQHVTKTRRMAGGVFQRFVSQSGRRRARAEMMFHSPPPLRRLFYAATASGLGTGWERIQLAGVLIALRLTWAGEWLRLELGSNPERR